MTLGELVAALPAKVEGRNYVLRLAASPSVMGAGVSVEWGDDVIATVLDIRLNPDLTIRAIYLIGTAPYELVKPLEHISVITAPEA